MSAAEASAASLSSVTKRFGPTTALAGVSLAVGVGEVVALLGPNGAGKTTALRILMGLRRPDEGEARLFGRDPRDWRSRRPVGLTPQDTDFPGTLRVREVVDLVRAHYTDPLPRAEVLDRFGLAEVEGRQTGGLSGGQRRRLAVALAFAGRPRAVFLDEPTAGLDVAGRRQAAEFVRSFARDGGTVLLTTHDLAEAEELASRVVVIHRGQVLADGALAEIRARAGLARVRLRAGDLPPLAGVERHERDGDLHTLYPRDPGDLLRQLVLAGVALEGVEVRPSTLEEAFLALTGEAGGTGEAG